MIFIEYSRKEKLCLRMKKGQHVRNLGGNFFETYSLYNNVDHAKNEKLARGSHGGPLKRPNEVADVEKCGEKTRCRKRCVKIYGEGKQLPGNKRR